MNASRNALVTGAGAGIGSATARLLAARGHNVWLTYANDSDAAHNTAASCRDYGVQAAVSALDLRSPESIERLAADIDGRWGSLHVLVNNAGSCPYTAWPDITVEEWDQVMETNARGTFLMIRQLLPLLGKATGDRSVVNVASLAGQVGGLTTSVHYAASKAATLAITRSLARRLAADGIRVNAVSPGPVDTAITANLDPAERDALIGSVPLARFGRPDNVAHAICLLATPDSGFTTGATYDVNGGLRME